MRTHYRSDIFDLDTDSQTQFYTVLMKLFSQILTSKVSTMKTFMILLFLMTSLVFVASQNIENEDQKVQTKRFALFDYLPIEESEYL